LRFGPGLWEYMHQKKAPGRSFFLMHVFPQNFNEINLLTRGLDMVAWNKMHWKSCYLTQNSLNVNGYLWTISFMILDIVSFQNNIVFSGQYRSTGLLGWWIPSGTNSPPDRGIDPVVIKIKVPKLQYILVLHMAISKTYVSSVQFSMK